MKAARKFLEDQILSGLYLSMKRHDHATCLPFAGSFAKRSLLFGAILLSIFLSAKDSMAQRLSDSQAMFESSESAFLPKCLPPGATIVSATEEIVSDTRLTQAIERAIAEWNRALDGLGATLSFEPYSERTNILIQPDSLMDQAGADSGIAEIVCKYSTSKEAKSEIDLSDVYVVESRIGISTASKGDPQKLYRTILYQLGGIIGLNTPEFTGMPRDSSRAITSLRRKDYVTDSDIALCKERYSNHGRQQNILAFARSLEADSSEAGQIRLKQALTELRALVKAERGDH